MNYLQDETAPDRITARVWSAVVASSAVDLLDRIDVVIPDLDPNLRWQDCRWQPRDGISLPQRGNECVVVIDNNGEVWVVTWWPDVLSFDTAWHYVGTAGEPVFLNSYINLDGTGDARNARFRKLSSNLVVLSGIVKMPNSTSNPIFALPTGYRPGIASSGNDFYFAQPCRGDAFAAVSIIPNTGAVHFRYVVPGGDYTNAWLSLSGIQFYADS